MSVKLANAAAGQASTKVKALGVAFADTSRRELGVADFVDTDLYSNLEVRVCGYMHSRLNEYSFNF